jgi:hypothetical protein
MVWKFSADDVCRGDQMGGAMSVGPRRLLADAGLPEIG